LDNYLYSNSDDSEDIGGGIRISAKGKMVTDDYIIIDEFVNELQKTKVDLAAYSERLHINLNALLETVTDELQRENLIVKQNNEIKLTRSGLFFGNNIISEFAGLIIGARKKDMEEAC
jgi:oxygen-independent coproporphyrinogen-3 oxidase